MRTARNFSAVGLVIGLVAATHGSSAAPRPHASPAIVEVFVMNERVKVADVLPESKSKVAEIDLGPAPPPRGSRFIQRVDLTRAIEEHGEAVPTGLPQAFRVVRKMRRLDAAELEQEIRRGAQGALGKGASLAQVKAPASVDIADGWTASRVELPRPPRRSGTFSTIATLVFVRDAEIVARVPVPVELALGPEAAQPDLARGAAVTLIIERGLVEITVAGVAGADADVGSVLPVMLHDSGRVVRAQLIETSPACRAVAVGGGA